MSDYLIDLKKTIKSGKIGQIKSLLSQVSERHPQEKLEVIEILALTSDKIALELLSFLTSAEHQDPEIHDRLIQLTTDRAHLNFNFVFILLNNGNDQIIHQSIPLIRHILSNETDKDLLNKLIRTTGMMQLDQLTDDIAEFIFYDDILLKSESIKALERIGTENACNILVQASKTDKCDDDILDAIQVLTAKTKDQEKTIEEPAPAIEPQPEPEVDTPDTSLLVSADLYERFKGYQQLSQKDPKVSARLLRQSDEDDHDLSILLLKLIKRTIPFSAAIRIFELLGQKKTPVNTKFAAYSALEAFPELKSAASVVQGLSESSMAVRIAAIRVLDKNLSDFVFAEIKNKIESGTKKGEALAENILDARAENIIEQLMISDTFSYIASNYLSTRAPMACLDTFIKILEKRKLKSTARKYQDIKESRVTGDLENFIVVSDCEALLNTYNKLIYTCGFSSMMFRQPQDAFEAMLANKPKAIISEIFLNDITGFDFTKEIRDLYPADDVPVILTTLQKDLDKSQLESEMERFGVNGICEFPATASQIKSWVK